MLTLSGAFTFFTHQINNNIIFNGIYKVLIFDLKLLAPLFLFDRAANTNQPYRLLQNRILLFESCRITVSV